MATIKTTSSDYTINVGPYDTGNTKWAGTMNVNGNLNVAGNITYVSDISVNDAFIVVAANNTGTVNDMGMVATKIANTSYAGLRFDVTANAWQISSSVNFDGSPVSSYANIAVGSASVAGANTELQFNDGGSGFGASANLTFNKVTNVLTLAGSQALGNIGGAPSSVSNAVVLYNNTTGPGGTGLYVVSATVSDEVTAYNKAKLLALIL